MVSRSPVAFIFFVCYHDHMAMPEQYLAGDLGERPQNEHLDPRHFYAAYVFDNGSTRRRDITVLIDQAQRLERPVRYWWLSEAMDLQGSPDRLIVCVHHPSPSVDAGMDLYRALEHHQTTWDDLDSAAVEEYGALGKSVSSPHVIFEPDGTPLFPEPESNQDVLFAFTKDDVQFVAQATLNRDLNEEEMAYVARELRGALDWIGAVEVTLTLGHVAGKIGPSAREDEPSDIASELAVRELPQAGWSETFQDASGHVLGKVDVVAGIAEDGEIYLRRVWGSATAPPLGFTPHDWGPAFALGSDDTLDDVLVYLDELLNSGNLSPQERTLSETYYRRLFSKIT